MRKKGREKQKKGGKNKKEGGEREQKTRRELPKRTEGQQAEHVDRHSRSRLKVGARRADRTGMKRKGKSLRGRKRNDQETLPSADNPPHCLP